MGGKPEGCSRENILKARRIGSGRQYSFTILRTQEARRILGGYDIIECPVKVGGTMLIQSGALGHRRGCRSKL